MKWNFYWMIRKLCISENKISNKNVIVFEKNVKNNMWKYHAKYNQKSQWNSKWLIYILKMY